MSARRNPYRPSRYRPPALSPPQNSPQTHRRNSPLSRSPLVTRSRAANLTIPGIVEKNAVVTTPNPLAALETQQVPEPPHPPTTQNPLSPPHHPANPSRSPLSNAQNASDSEEDLQKIYTRIKSIPNFSAKIADFLRKNNNYSQHRRIVKKTFPRRKIITQYPFQIFQADLIEYPKREYANNGNRFILLIIDSFSKMIYAESIKRKNSFYMAAAFERVLNKFDFFPNSIITDQGLEFFNASVQKVFQSYGINHYYLKTRTPWKTPMAERAIRTIKSRLERYMRFHKTKRWIDILPQMIKNYNRTPHRTIGMAPVEVTFHNSGEIYKKVFGDSHFKVIPRLSIGDSVRILKEKTFFEKGYTPNWSEEVYKISDVIQKAGIVWYKISTVDNKILPSIKYYYQLNLVSKHKDATAR